MSTPNPSAERVARARVREEYQRALRATVSPLTLKRHGGQEAYARYHAERMAWQDWRAEPAIVERWLDEDG